MDYNYISEEVSLYESQEIQKVLNLRNKVIYRNMTFLSSGIMVCIITICYFVMVPWRCMICDVTNRDVE